MASFSKDQWSRELATEAETLLTALVKNCPGVTNIRGCSYEGYRDFKIAFDYDLPDEVPIRGCFLSFQPVNGISYPDSGPCLESWVGGLPHLYPPLVMLHLNTIIPSPRAERKGVGRDTWKYWLMNEETFRRIASRQP